MKISEYLYSSTDRCCIVFGENRNSLNIQNGGPKFVKIGIADRNLKNWKTKRKYSLIFIKISEYLSFRPDHCSTNFRENCK